MADVTVPLNRAMMDMLIDFQTQVKQLEADLKSAKAELSIADGRVNALLATEAETFLAEQQRDDAVAAARWLYENPVDEWPSLEDEALKRWPWLKENERVD